MPATSSAASSSSSRSAHRMTPAASSAADVTRSSPARLPLCATAAACACARPPDLDRQDRLAQLQRAVAEGQEQLGPLEPLDEQHDGVGLGVVEAVGEVVAQVEDHLGADGHDPAVPDPRPRRVEERVGDAARLRQAGDVAARQPWVDVADVGRAVGRPVDGAHAVGPEQRDAVPDRDLRDRALHRGGRLAALDDAAARDHEARDAGVGGLLREARRAQRVDGEDHRVRPLRERVERREARLPERLGVVGVDEVAARLAAHPREVVADRERERRARAGARRPRSTAARTAAAGR